MLPVFPMFFDLNCHGSLHIVIDTSNPHEAEWISHKKKLTNHSNHTKYGPISNQREEKKRKCGWHLLFLCATAPPVKSKFNYILCRRTKYATAKTFEQLIMTAIVILLLRCFSFTPRSGILHEFQGCKDCRLPMDFILPLLTFYLRTHEVFHLMV